MKRFLIYLFTLFLIFTACDDDPNIDPDGNTGASIVDEDTITISKEYRFPDTLLAYVPAPSQFVNVAPGRPQDAQSIIRQKGFVTLGGWGGYIIVGYNDPIINHYDNPFGVDFTIFGNAYDGSSEPGIVCVMKDENKNGQPDDTWYELHGAEHNNKSTYHNYQLTYYKPNDTTVVWKDNQGQKDTLLRNSYHTQSYYPTPEFFSNYPSDSITFKGTLLPTKSYEETPGHWVNPTYNYGYADNIEVNWSEDLDKPDNPDTEEIEGAGGDAFKLEWAVDSEGQSVKIDTIHFIKIYNGVNFCSPVIGEVSTEIKAIVAVK